MFHNTYPNICWKVELVGPKPQNLHAKQLVHAIRGAQANTESSIDKCLSTAGPMDEVLVHAICEMATGELNPC